MLANICLIVVAASSVAAVVAVFAGLRGIATEIDELRLEFTNIYETWWSWTSQR